MDIVRSGDVLDDEAGCVEGRLRTVDRCLDLRHDCLELGHGLSVVHDIDPFVKGSDEGSARIDQSVMGILYFGGWVEVFEPVDAVADDEREADYEILKTREVGFVGDGHDQGQLREQRLELRIDVSVDGLELGEVFLEGELVRITAAGTNEQSRCQKHSGCTCQRSEFHGVSS